VGAGGGTDGDERDEYAEQSETAGIAIHSVTLQGVTARTDAAPEISRG
jgi:hypothetical protein